MALLLPYYHEVREKYNQDRFQGISYNALELFVHDFLRDRSIFAIFGLDDLYQAGTLTETHFRDLDSWDWFISENLDLLDDMVDELDESGELDDLEGLAGRDDQDQEEPRYSVAFSDGTPRSELLDSVEGRDEEAVDRLLCKAPRIVDAEILCTAIHYYNPTIFNLLVCHGAQLDGDPHNSPLWIQSFPLCTAAEHGNLDALKLLLAHGADPEGKSWSRGWTPLAAAACKGEFEIVRYLIEEQRADIHGSLLCRPLWCAIANGHSHIVDYLLTLGADVSKGGLSTTRPWQGYYNRRLHFPQTGEMDYRVHFKRLIPNCCSRSRYILLSRAAADGDLNLVEYVVSFGVDVNSVTNESPLYHATKNGRSDVVRFLLGHATKIHPADVSGLLWCAAENKDLDIIYLLLGCGPQLYPTLFSELLSVTVESGDRYRSKADGKAHDGLSLCLSKDKSFAEWDSWVSDSRYLGANSSGARQLRA